MLQIQFNNISKNNSKISINSVVYAIDSSRHPTNQQTSQSQACINLSRIQAIVNKKNISITIEYKYPIWLKWLALQQQKNYNIYM